MTRNFLDWFDNFTNQNEIPKLWSDSTILVNKKKIPKKWYLNAIFWCCVCFMCLCVFLVFGVEKK